MGFQTTTHDRCVYRQVADGSVQLLLRQVDDFLLACDSEKTAKAIFDTIGKKIQFPTEKERNIIPFEYLGVVKDYNGVDLIQTPDYIESNCASYLHHLIILHGWDTDSKKALPADVLPVSDKDVRSSGDSEVSGAINDISKITRSSDATRNCGISNPIRTSDVPITKLTLVFYLY